MPDQGWVGGKLDRIDALAPLLSCHVCNGHRSSYQILMYMYITGSFSSDHENIAIYLIFSLIAYYIFEAVKVSLYIKDYDLRETETLKCDKIFKHLVVYSFIMFET